MHGLERQYKGDIDFLYLDVQEQGTGPAGSHLGYRATPHFFLLSADGKVLKEWQGVQERQVLETALQAVVGGT